MTNPRMRMAAVGGSLALTATMLAAPAGLTQDEDPAATFGEFAAALEVLDLETLPTFFCIDQAGALGGIGVSELTAGMPPGFDFMLDAIDITIDVEKAETLSQSETEAIVDVQATMTMEFDIEAVMPMLLEMLEGFGASEDEIAAMQSEMLAEVPEAEMNTIAGEITLVPGETRPWVICSDLEPLNSGSMSGDDMDDADMDDADMDDMDDMDEMDDDTSDDE